MGFVCPSCGRLQTSCVYRDASLNLICASCNHRWQQREGATHVFPQNNKFWMVWNLDGHAPMVKHPDLESAQKEAERLAKKHKRTFVVLESLMQCEVAEPPVAWVKLS